MSNIEHGNRDAYQPPPGPPPLLSSTQLEDLSRNGYLSLELPSHVEQLYTVLSKQMTSFFALPTSQKQILFPSTGGTESGYTLLPEEKEYLTLRHRSYNSIPGPNSPYPRRASDISFSNPDPSSISEALESTASDLWTSSSKLLARILNDVSTNLGLRSPRSPQQSPFTPLLRNTSNMPSSLTDSTPSLLRLFNYFPTSIANSHAPEGETDKGDLITTKISQTVADPHRDLGLLTLCFGFGAGLEVWDRNNDSPKGGNDGISDRNDDDRNDANSRSDGGDWIPAAPVTLLVGDTLRILTTNRFRSGLHRVVVNPDGRLSIVFALRCNTDCTVELADFGGEGTVNSGALWDAIKRKRVNVNASKEVRAGQKARKEEDSNC